MLRHAVAIAGEHQAQAVLVCGGSIPDRDLFSVATGVKVVFLLAGESGASAAHEFHHIIRVPYLPPTRMSQIRMGILLALSRGLLQPNDTVVCVSGLTDSGVLDAVVAMRVGEEFDMFLGPNQAHWETSDVRPDVLQRVIELATELAIEGREGNPVGALFVLGDIPNVLPKTHQMVLNPFQGYRPDQCNLLEPVRLGETVKEFSTIDGAFLIRGDGVIVSAGAHIDSSLIVREHLPQGLGARHRAAAAIAAVTNAIAIVLSQSTGNVTIFRKGRVVAEIPRPTRPQQERVPALLRLAAPAQRILVVGGGIGGLSIALRLAETGLPVTVLEAGCLGSGATMRNQGWLWSGAMIARYQPELARMFHTALQQTLTYCPGCVEPQTGRMLYLFTAPQSRIYDWTDAWRTVGIPCEPVTIPEVAKELPQIDLDRINTAFRLPDCSIRTDLLLNQLAVAARQAGAEIRTETPVAELLREGNRVKGVLTTQGDEIPAQAVILAAGAAEYNPLPMANPPPAQAGLRLLKTHLIAVYPGIARTPFCLADQGGFNHLPHGDYSVFGSNRWIPAASVVDHEVIPEEIGAIWHVMHQFFPQLQREDMRTMEWAGTTVQKSQNGTEQPFEVLAPTLFEPEPLQNVLSATAGRLTLWPILAEETRQAVLAMLNATPSASPPWVGFAAR
jgi:DNA integrity scanning protein DisA with diadenylate cyclase activity/glycine/D-amino acid oxidase-like deaminating enzyme